MSSIDNNYLKTPLAQSLQKLGRAKSNDAVAAMGKGLPCTVAEVIGPGIVRVNFEVAAKPAPLPQVVMPVGKPPYIQYPIQVGDIGVAISADLRTGGLTGLGSGVPNMGDTVGNLAAMTFFWLGSTSETFVDPQAVTIYQNIVCTPTQLAFFKGAKVSQQAVAGAVSSITDPAAKAVIQSLLSALANYDLIKNNTT
jgi:hypothetical protein